MRIPKTFFRPTVWWIAVSAWFVLLFVLSSQSNFVPTRINFSDKIAHFCYFAAGGTCFFLAFRLQEPPPHLATTLLLTILFAGLVGWFDEWHQTLVPGRSGNDLGDWIADITGGTFGCVIGALWFHWTKKQAKDGTESQMIRLDSNR